MAKRPLDPHRPLTRRALITPADLAVCTVRGVEWVTDRYVLARRDLFRSPPNPAGTLAGNDLTRAVTGLLRTLRHADPVELTDTRTVIDLNDDARHAAHRRTVRLLTALDARVLAIDQRAADEWLTRGWSAIEQRGKPVTFWRRHAGRNVLVGAVMPVMLGRSLYSSTGQPATIGTLRLLDA